MLAYEDCAVLMMTKPLMLSSSHSQAVIDEVIKTEHVPVRVNGPMGGESILAQGYDHVLMIAGGVAVSFLSHT